MKRFALSLLILLIFAGVANAQNTGEIFGRVTDRSGAVIPGVSVTLSSPVRLQPLVAVTSETGTYQFPGLAIGAYSVKFELSGFGTFLRENIIIEIGFRAQINAELAIATLEQAITVTAASPVVDVKSTTQVTHFDLQTLQAVPSAIDMFAMAQQTPAIVVSRNNIAGAESSSPTTISSYGAAPDQTGWFVDGVNVAGAGRSDSYNQDFDTFEAIQVTTSGADASLMSPGANFNIVTKSGGDTLKGTIHAYVADKTFLNSTNVTDALRAQGATSGNPLFNNTDYGFDVGGPIKRGRAWFWGAYKRQDLKFGVNNYYRKTSDCAPIAANPLQYPIDQVQDCLNNNTVNLYHISYKVGIEPFKGNLFTFTNRFDAKYEDVRLADDLHPPESTTNLGPIMVSAIGGQYLGRRYWSMGWPATWKFADQHILSDRWLVDFGYSHFGRGTQQSYHQPSLATVQPMFEISTSAWARSFQTTYGTQLTDTRHVTTNYFLPGKWGGEHSVKASFQYVTYERAGGQAVGGDAIARFNSGAGVPAFSVPFSAFFYRNALNDSFLSQPSAYIQETYTRKRLTLNLGVRWDRQNDREGPVSVPASPFQGQTTMNGTAFNFLPALNFSGSEGGVIWNTVVPRLGAVYDLTGDGKTVLNASFSRYYNQRGTGELAATLKTIGLAFVEFPWRDLNGDRFVQVNEVDTSRALSFGGGYNPANPAQTESPNQIDPNVKPPQTDEIVIGASREMAANFGVSVNYVWRKYSDFNWMPRIGLSSANYSPVTFTPAATACPAEARCEAVTYHVPNIPLPAPFILTNRPNYDQRYQGFNVVLRKRMSQRWMMNASLASNDHKQFFRAPDAYQDPTNISTSNGQQYAYSAQRQGEVFLSMRWVARLTGSYRLPWYNTGVSVAYDRHQGYPFLQSINIASRPNAAGGIQVLLDPIGAVRLPTFQQLDLKVDSSFTFGRVKVQPFLDIFNLLNSSEEQVRQRNQNASNANRISLLPQPRVAQLGFRLSF